jgi:long-subunit fatty acid transport protein
MRCRGGVRPAFVPAVLAVVLASGITAGRAGAQDEVILPELPFTLRNGVGARSAGMGFAHAAVVEDGSALYYNPAGLAQIRRIELSGGLLHDSQNRDVGFDTGIAPNSLESADISATQPDHLSLAYPFPAYRGSLVLGLAYQRASSLKSDYFRDGVLREPVGTTPGLYESESFTEGGEVNYWTVGVGGDVSPHVSLGASISYIQGSTSQDFTIGRFRLLSDGSTDVEGSDEVFQSIEKRDADLNGVTGSVGVLAHASEMTRFGLTVDFPQRYEFDGTVASTFEDQEKIDTDRFGFNDTITLPFSFLAGLAFTPSNWLFAADARFTDWTQIDFEGPVRSQDRENAYRSTVDFNLGAEFQIPSSPTRIRAGFSSQPLPYRLIPGEIDFTFVPDDPNTTGEASFFTREYPEANIDTDRYFITFGAGTLIDNTVSLDLAYVRGMYKRSADTIEEEWTTNRVFGTATFRF